MDVVGPQSSVLIVSLPAQLQLFAEKRDLGSIGLDGFLDKVKVELKLDTCVTLPVSLLDRQKAKSRPIMKLFLMHQNKKRFF